MSTHREQFEYLRETDPIHYCEMMGDPVTGLGNDKASSVVGVIIAIVLIVFGVLIGISI